MFTSPEILEYHRKLLDLPSPWTVRSVDVNVGKLEVTIDVFWPANTFAPCPECNQLCSLKDSKSRLWRHLDTMQFKTYLRCDVPRVDCAEHGVLQMYVPWSDPKSRFTALFEKLAAELLLCAKNQTQAAGLLRISWKQMHLIQKRSVEKALELRRNDSIGYLGIDEKSFLKGHRYVTVLSDLNSKCVIDVSEGRDEIAATKAFECLNEAQKRDVKAVAMDMWVPYKAVVEKEIPHAEIVHDKFHVSKYLTKAVDSVRKQEHRAFMKSGVEVLKGTKYLWLTNQMNWNDNQRLEFQELRGLCLKVGRAFSMKESFRNFWTYRNKGSAHSFFKKWYFWATHSRLKPLVDVAKTLKRHIDNILTYFNHRISNSAAEGINAKIQIIKSEARGFRNFSNFRIAILFHCGGFKFFPLNWA